MASAVDHDRHTQAERSAATKARLLDATVECLADLGWAGTSTTEVVRRAGVSRGAQVHHYPTKDDLVLAAMDHVVERRRVEYREAFDALPAERRTPDEAFEMLWDTCFGRTFDAWLELAVAARRSPSLHERFVAQEREFTAATVDQFQELFPDVFGDREVAEVAMRFTFSTLDGLAISRLVGTPEPELAAAREAFRIVTSAFLASEGVTT